MTSEILSNSEHLLQEAATQIRSAIKTSVSEDLHGIFPKNHVYQCGDYNLIYVVAEPLSWDKYGFCSDAKMVALNPEGDISSGIVHQDVGSWTSWWEFTKATLQVASDEDIIRYSPQLVSNLLGQLEKETWEEKDPEKINKVISYLHNKSLLYNQLLSVSRKSLLQLGEEDPQLVHKVKVDPYNEDILKSIVSAFEEQNPEYQVVKKLETKSYLEQKKAAIDLYIGRDEIINNMSEIASERSVYDVMETFKDIVNSITEKEIFPTDYTDEDGIAWFQQVKRVISIMELTGTRTVNLYSKSSHKDRTWRVSELGQVAEFNTWGEGEATPISCEEHLLEQAPEIVNFLIEGSAKKYFPNLR